MVDRDARERLAALIRRYLGEEIKAFELDDALEAFRDSHDEAVSFTAAAMWNLYDDVTDHQVALSKEGWDYVQRLLLLLESDAAMSVTTSRQWHYTQAIAATLLLGCAAIVVHNGFEQHVILLFVPFGIGSILLSFLRSGEDPADPDPRTAPFRSVRQLSRVRRSARFRKARHPAGVGKRTIRPPVLEAVMWLNVYFFWALFAPLPLLVQCFPPSMARVEVNPA